MAIGCLCHFDDIAKAFPFGANRKNVLTMRSSDILNKDFNGLQVGFLKFCTYNFGKASIAQEKYLRNEYKIKI